MYKQEIDLKILIACCILLPAITGCGKPEVRQESSKPVAEGKATEPIAAPSSDTDVPKEAAETKEAETVEDDRHCPTSDDVSQSIAEFKQLYKDAQSLLHEYKIAGRHNISDKLKSKTSQWQTQNTAWNTKNNKLIDWCELLLGADGTETSPEIPVSLGILKKADDWMCKALVAADNHEFAYSKVYLASAFKAFNKARNVSLHVIGAHSRAASASTPKTIKAVEKKMAAHEQ